MTVEETVLIEIIVSPLPEEIMIMKTGDGWAYCSGNKSWTFASLDKFFQFRYQLEIPALILKKITELVCLSSRHQEILKVNYIIPIGERSYIYEIRSIPISSIRTLLIFDRIFEEKEIKEIKTNYDTLFEQNTFGILILDSNHTLLRINERACNLFDRHMNHLIGKPFSELFYYEDIPKVRRYLKLPYTLKATSSGLELRVTTGNNEISWLLVSLNPISDDSILPRSYTVIISDIKEFKKLEEEKKREKMRFNIEGKNVYWIDEVNSNMCYSVFDDYLSLGYPGVVLSRTSEDNLRSFIAGDFKFVWLGKNDVDDTKIDVLLTLKKTILELPKRSVLLFENIDYLLLNHEFDLVHIIVQILRDMALWKNLIVLIPINKMALDDNYWKILEKE